MILLLMQIEPLHSVTDSIAISTSKRIAPQRQLPRWFAIALCAVHRAFSVLEQRPRAAVL